MKKLIHYSLAIAIVCSMANNTTECAGRAGVPAIPTPPRSIQQTIKAIKNNDAQIIKIKNSIQEEAKDLIAAKNTGSQADQKKAEKALKASIDQMNTLSERSKNLFGSGERGKKLQELAKLRKERFEAALDKERQHFLTLTTKKQKDASIAKQKSLENKINIEQIALGDKWSNATKSALLAAGVAIAAAGVDWYLGTGYLKAGVAGAKMAAGKAQEWWSPTAPGPITKQQRRMVGAYMPDLSSQELPASEIEDMFISSGDVPTTQPPTGWFEKATSGWPTWESLKGYAGSAASTTKKYIYDKPASWLGGAAAGAVGSMAIATGKYVLSVGFSMAKMQAMGYVFNKAIGYWMTPAGERVVNPNGTPYVASDQMPTRKDAQNPTMTQQEE